MFPTILITYIFWARTKTINFVRCLWHINIKSVRSFCTKCNCLWLTCTFLWDSQITTTIHWPSLLLLWLCVVFLDGSEDVLAFIVCLLCTVKIQLSRGVGSGITLIPPHVSMCQMSAPRFSTTYAWSFYYVQWFEVRNDCSLGWYWWSCWPMLKETLSRNERGRFGAFKSDSTHHFFRNTCTKSGSLRFSQFSGCWLILSVYILMSFDFPFVRLFGVR